MATSRQQQRPLKPVPTAKITSQNWPVHRLMNGVYKTPFFMVKGEIDSYCASLVFVSVWFVFYRYKIILIVICIYVL